MLYICMYNLMSDLQDGEQGAVIQARPVTDNSPYTCIHCGKECKNWKALVSHLKGCPERKLKRMFDIGPYRFTITLNPHKRRIRGLRNVAEKYPDEYKIFMGAVFFMKEAGLIHDFKIEKIEQG